MREIVQKITFGARFGAKRLTLAGTLICNRMNTQSRLITLKAGGYEYIYIYFKFKKKLIRINTKNRVDDKCMRTDLLYTKDMKNYKVLNDRILLLKRKVDEYITYRINYGWFYISIEDCLKYVNSGSTDMRSYVTNNPVVVEVKEAEIKPLSVNDYLSQFYQFKKDELNNRASYKDYLSLVNALTDYQSFYKMELTFENMNTPDFMVKFRNFLSLERGEGFLTDGGLNDNTINKRISGLKGFFTWCEIREYYTFKKIVHAFKTAKYDNNIIVLSKEEITLLTELELMPPSWERIIAVFVCNCFMGLRFGDLVTLKKSEFIKNDDGDWTLKKKIRKRELLYMFLSKIHH